MQQMDSYKCSPSHSTGLTLWWSVYFCITCIARTSVSVILTFCHTNSRAVVQSGCFVTWLSSVMLHPLSVLARLTAVTCC